MNQIRFLVHQYEYGFSQLAPAFLSQNNLCHSNMEEQHNSFYNGNKTLYVISESTGDKKLQITEVLPREKRRTKSQGNFSPSPYTISKNLLRETTTTTTTWEKLNLQNFLRGGWGSMPTNPPRGSPEALKKTPYFPSKGTHICQFSQIIQELPRWKDLGRNDQLPLP